MDIFAIDLLMPHFFLEVKDINIINELGRISAAQIHFDEVLRVHALIKNRLEEVQVSSRKHRQEDGTNKVTHCGLSIWPLHF